MLNPSMGINIYIHVKRKIGNLFSEIVLNRKVTMKKKDPLKFIQKPLILVNTNCKAL